MALNAFRVDFEDKNNNIEREYLLLLNAEIKEEMKNQKWRVVLRRLKLGFIEKMIK